MGKVVNFIKRKCKCFLSLAMIFLIIFVNVTRVSAIRDYDVTWNRKEHQLVQKIRIIKAVFGDSVDEAALYAVLVHRGTLTDYVVDSYDENFSEEGYRTTWDGLKLDIGNLATNIGQVAESLFTKLGAQIECAGSDDTDCVMNAVIKHYSDKLNAVGVSDAEGKIKTPKNIDLLTAATIVMLDSSGWNGKYSDEKFQKALAGKGLVGNNFDENNTIQNFIGQAFNGIFCTGVDIYDTLSWFNPSVDFTTNTEFGVENIQKKVSKYYTMSKVCNYGFVGGTYSSLNNFDTSTDEMKERYQLKKDIIAKEIIAIAKMYRTDDGDLCQDTGTAGAIGEGDITNWRQYDERWADIPLGTGGVSLKRWGCTTTSISYILAKSGTQLTVTDFNPGVYAQKGGYLGSYINWDFSGIAPNVHKMGFFQDLTTSNYVQKITDIINTPYQGKQQFVIIQLLTGGEHWVAVDHVENGVVYVLDPSAPAGQGLVDLTTAHRWGSIGGYNILYADDVDFNSSGSSSSSSSSSSGNVCGPTGTADMDKLLTMLRRLEGEPGSCQVRGKEGYKTYYDSMDQTNAGTTTTYGITQVYNVDLANSLGYTNFNSDMSNGCVEKEYIDEMGKQAMENAVAAVKADWESQSGGKTLEEYQYHALALVYHHWPVGVNLLIGKLATLSDVRSYDAFHWFLYYNGLKGQLGGLNRREAEFHLFYNGNYDAERDNNVNDSVGYYNSRVELYKSEQVN